MRKRSEFRMQKRSEFRVQKRSEFCVRKRSEFGMREEATLPHTKQREFAPADTARVGFSTSS